ncbi:MAG: histidine kinase [Deltaproteobacteria bacterium]|nr:histidine kinase [Deltaproteobacteria bacterium]MBW2086396.1 histidine kinase [Deltaproteobacteria bacterium]
MTTVPEGDKKIPIEKEYFQRLRLRLKFGLLLALMVPLAALSFYFHFQFNSTLKESGKVPLAALAESQGNTIDLFFQERLVNIFSLFHSQEFNLSPSKEDMIHYLANLRQASDAFIDVGFFDERGTQIGYAGPFSDLHGKDYSGEKWLTTLMKEERNYFISDIYEGFRNKLHFTIAVKQLIDRQPYVMRATLDPEKFYLFLRTISRGKGVDSALINKEGFYQVVNPERGELFGKSEYMPARTEGSGIEEVRVNGDSVLIAYAWLKETPWVLVVSQPFSLAYAKMYQTRRIMIASTALIVLIIAGAIWFTVDRLVKRAEATSEAREELKSQLYHASKLASVGELAAGVAHEINNPLAIIFAESGLIRDMLDPEIELDGSPGNMRQGLAHIDAAVFRAKGITQKLLNVSRKTTPRLVPCDINEIIEDVVSGLKEKELQVHNIKLIRDYDYDLPEISLDPDQISQVFLNLINNAGDAIKGPGTITISTRRDNRSLRVTIKDTGVGMTSEQMSKIFLPFYTTKDVGKGTGLGLSISLSVVESLGGRIEVQSMSDAGSSFTVVLPINEPGESDYGGRENSKGK